MLQQPRSLKRSLVAGLAVCAIAPAGAVASPIAGQGVAAGGGPGVSAKDFPQQQDVEQQDFRAPDQVAGRGISATTHTHRVAPATSSKDDGVDTGIWVALGGAALMVAGGIGAVGRKRLRIGRQRQLA